jgi:hypothetical protein
MTDFKLSSVQLEETVFKGRKAFRVSMPASAYQDPAKDVLTDRDLMAWRPIDFGDGTIEVDVASTIAPDAPPFARGFIGIAFRIDGGKTFESIYLRPANSRVDDQVRRNHAIQYWAYPDFDFARLRREEPEKYESYVDLALDEWITMKIVVQGSQARLYVNGAPQGATELREMRHWFLSRSSHLRRALRFIDQLRQQADERNELQGSLWVILDQPVSTRVS